MRPIRRALVRLPRGPRDVLLWTGGTAVFVLVAWSGYVLGAGTFSGERAGLLEDEATYRNALASFRDERTKRPELDRALQSFADRSLGSDLVAADSALRARLNRIGEEVRLDNLRVTTGSATVRLSPAKAEFSRTGRQKRLRDEEDFIEVQATIAGEASAEQALRLVHRIQVEPWIKRIDGVRWEALRDGERIKVTVRLTTLLLPGRKGKVELRPSEIDLAGWDRFRAMAESNPFRVPQPAKEVAVAPPPPPSTPPPPAGFPYDQWMLTGLVQGPTGLEAWLRNGATGEQLALTPGQSVGELTFAGTAAESDVAEFAQGDDRFTLTVGSALSLRQARPR